MNVAAVGAFHQGHFISPVVIVVIVVVVVVEDKAAYQRDSFCGVWGRFRSYVKSRGMTNERAAHHGPYDWACFTAMRSQVLIIFRPAERFLTGPRPPALLAARFLAEVILPPLLFFAILKSPLESLFQLFSLLS